MRPYLLAQICYNPTNPEHPWYITRNGTIFGQGGPYIGTESSSFQTLECACNYIQEIIELDMEVIKDLISKDCHEKET